MKTSHLFLSLVSLGFTVIAANAASPENTDNECVQMPAYTVEVPRHDDVERQIARSLDELRAAARKPLAVAVEFALQPAPASAEASPAKPAPVVVIAKS